jgi:hypothetical protein
MAAHETAKDRNSQAADVLRRLDEMGAINLDTLVAKSAEIKAVTGSISELDPGDMCYPFVIRIGPRHDFDLVTVSNELRQLGFEVKRTGKS